MTFDQGPTSRRYEAIISDQTTDFIVTVYTDRIVFIATQVETLGTMVHAHKETVLGGGETFVVDTILGPRDNPLPELCARQLVERMGKEHNIQKPILLCLGLKPQLNDPTNASYVIKQIVDTIVAHPAWD